MCTASRLVLCVVALLPAISCGAWPSALKLCAAGEYVFEAPVITAGEGRDISFTSFGEDIYLPAEPIVLHAARNWWATPTHGHWLLGWSTWHLKEGPDDLGGQLVDHRFLTPVAGTDAAPKRGLQLELPGADVRLQPVPARRISGLVVGLRYVELQLLSGSPTKEGKPRTLPMVPTTLEMIAAPRLEGVTSGTFGTFGQGVDLGIERRY